MAGDGEVARVMVFDTTLRDGYQTPGCGLAAAAKVQVAKRIALLGVDVIEAGFPAAGPGELAAVTATARQFRSTGPTICGLARALPADIDRCGEALRRAARPRIHTFIATSDLHLERKLRITRKEALAVTRAMVTRAKSIAPEVQFSAEDATRSPRGFLLEVFDVAVEAGARVINVPDTVGFATPEEYGELIGVVVQRYRAEGVIVSAHCHDDLGLALANSLAALRAGARQVECTVNGIGERAGNAALEELVMALRTRRERLRCDTGVDVGKLITVSRMVERRTKIPMAPNKAVVGRNAFAHQSGIHQAGYLADRSTYEVIDRETLGVDTEALVLGRLSGRRALRARLEALGLDSSGSELDRLFARFKRLAETKPRVSDDDLLELVKTTQPVEVTP